MLTPKILYESTFENGNFYSVLPDGYMAKESDFAIVSLPSEDYISDGRTQGKKIWAALIQSGVWRVEQAQLQYFIGSLSIRPLDHQSFEAVAYPIDPAMTREDIEGATRIYANADNTGWLFAHAETAHHHERIIQLEAVMHTLFEDLVHSNLESVLKVVVGANNPSPEIGTELLYNYNAQFGSLSNYSNLVAFRQECVKWCTELEKLLHVGQHVQQDDLYLQHQLVRAINQAKAIWKADTGKARNLATIESHVDAIIAKIETDHAIETRWEKAARIEAEKKKREAAEASDTETESPSD